MEDAKSCDKPMTAEEKEQAMVYLKEQRLQLAGLLLKVNAGIKALEMDGKTVIIHQGSKPDRKIIIPKFARGFKRN